MSSTTRPALSRAAFATLLLIAFMMGANHVAARMAFDNGVDVATAVVFRSGVTALVVAFLLRWFRVPVRLGPRHHKALPVIGLLVGVQSLCLYSSVARLPVALALLVAAELDLVLQSGGAGKQQQRVGIARGCQAQRSEAQCSAAERALAFSKRTHFAKQLTKLPDTPVAPGAQLPCDNRAP